MSIVLRWHLVKFNTTVAVNFSNSTYISTLPFMYALTVNLQKIFYNSKTSVGGRQYKIICVASLQKGPHVAKIKIEIFLDLNRAGHDKSVKKN